jgi:hypothetical protein
VDRANISVLLVGLVDQLQGHAIDAVAGCPAEIPQLSMVEQGW